MYFMYNGVILYILGRRRPYCLFKRKPLRLLVKLTYSKSISISKVWDSLGIEPLIAEFAPYVEYHYNTDP